MASFEPSKPKIGRKEAATKAAAAGQPDIRLGQWRRGNTGSCVCVCLTVRVCGGVARGGSWFRCGGEKKAPVPLVAHRPVPFQVGSGTPLFLFQPPVPFSLQTR